MRRSAVADSHWPGSSKLLAHTLVDASAQGRDKTQKDVNKYLKVYPVIESGIGIRF